MNLKTLKNYVVVFVLILSSYSTLLAQSNQFYIEKYSPVAQEMMHEHGVPASVILAIAMHESGNGKSRIAKNLNNHFGIKGKNNSKVIHSAYKGYKSVLDSYNDFISIVKRKKTTSSLFEEKRGEGYRAWVGALAKAGYSTTKDWSAKVIRTIEMYNLDSYDDNSSSNSKRLSSIK
ncbi:glucosaminidase domain-containing protein [Sphingobacterium sp. SRCM116780]|uniref:glucosaminidase domain-containing protein n=1 Tax=Sphingobacterium sp. SRCM116780 TaxID=2907623 RepID=UPI001F15F67F|nr:glucosaminidase domain-containing protein [Sphingobacterium sp. SRCM116780]UIR55768.1 glucosaminidase domain-containing protein [Sphingobacterium sp. SRCM116780]